MGKLLEKAMSPTLLDSAWRRLSTDKAIWAPSTSRAEMERNLVYHVLTLREEVLAGGYRPESLRHFTIAKADGKRRVLSALTLRDKLVQRAVLEAIEPLGEQFFHNDSFGYRPGRNVDQAVARARERIQCGLFWLVDADIKSFFDTIPHEPLFKIVKKLVPDREIVELMRRWLKESIPHQGILGPRRGLPQGGVLSPFLCNLYLHTFDQELSKNSIPFVRFADDFLLFAPTQKSAETAYEFARRQLEVLDLTLHPEKSRITKSGDHMIFLGQRLPPPRSAKKRGKRRNL